VGVAALLITVAAILVLATPSNALMSCQRTCTKTFTVTDQVQSWKSPQRFAKTAKLDLWVVINGANPGFADGTPCDKWIYGQGAMAEINTCGGPLPIRLRLISFTSHPVTVVFGYKRAS
jgi:hypothetical protein